MLAVAGEEHPMNAWSDYLRAQAVIAERLAKTMTSLEMVREFEGYAESFRQDAAAEDRTPTRAAID
jgi:hypothetical protein